VRPALRPVPTYLTPRGYVAADDLTAADMADVASVFRLVDSTHLTEDAFTALCEQLGLEVIRVAGVLMGRVRRARAA
jgi:hypothetical protein